MKKLTITIENKLANTNNTTFTAKSEANMWNILRSVRDSLSKEEVKAGVRAVVTDEVMNLFKDITFKFNKAGKIEMPNAVKETCRRQVAKAKAAAKLAAEKEEARKAKKREADRRYRAKKAAAKAEAAKKAADLEITEKLALA